MGMGSSVAGIIALGSVLSGESTFKENMASILTAVCMLSTMLIFPYITKIYQKHNEKKKDFFHFYLDFWLQFVLNFQLLFCCLILALNEISKI